MLKLESEGLHQQVIEASPGETTNPPTLAQRLKSIVRIIADDICLPTAVITARVTATNSFLNGGTLDGWVYPIIGAQATIGLATFIYNCTRPIEEILEIYPT